MKRAYKILLYLILLIILVLFSFFIVKKYFQVSADETQKISGWAWSENIGWLSLNCSNLYQGELENHCNINFGLDYNLVGEAGAEYTELTGWAWSDRAGWACFGRACTEAGLINSPDGLPVQAVIDDNGLVSGWANFVALGDNGWLDLSGIEQPVNPTDSKVACRGCLNDQCNFCFESDNYSGSKAIFTQCSICIDDSCTDCQKKFDYNLAFDFDRNTLFGWAWNGSSSDSSYGWLNFDADISLYPYLQTEDNQVYSRDGIAMPSDPPENIFNATYLVTSSGKIDKFYSSCDQGECLKENQPELSEKSFGFFDYSNILSGQQGKVVLLCNDSNPTCVITALNNPFSEPMDGKIFYVNKDLIIDDEVVFQNAINGGNGAGTVFVKGNLIIRDNLEYQEKIVGFADLREMASLGFIVVQNQSTNLGGNILIDANVDHLVGSYYAEKNIFTGLTDQKPLNVNGLMIANGFAFERSYVDPINLNPAEKISYDIRVLANTPPGFIDLVATLPRW